MHSLYKQLVEMAQERFRDREATRSAIESHPLLRLLSRILRSQRERILALVPSREEIRAEECQNLGIPPERSFLIELIPQRLVHPDQLDRLTEDVERIISELTRKIADDKDFQNKVTKAELGLLLGLAIKKKIPVDRVAAEYYGQEKLFFELAKLYGFKVMREEFQPDDEHGAYVLNGDHTIFIFGSGRDGNERLMLTVQPGREVEICRGVLTERLATKDPNAGTGKVRYILVQEEDISDERLQTIAAVTQGALTVTVFRR